MPLYDYQCKKCKHRFEKIQTFSARPITKCPECGGPVEKMITAPAVHFKGSGWYVNDYAKRPNEGKSSESSESGGDESSASKAVEKADTKSSTSDTGSGAKEKKTQTGTQTETKTESKTERKSESKSGSKKKR